MVATLSLATLHKYLQNSTTIPGYIERRLCVNSEKSQVFSVLDNAFQDQDSDQRGKLIINIKTNMLNLESLSADRPRTLSEYPLRQTNQ